MLRLLIILALLGAQERYSTGASSETGLAVRWMDRPVLTYCSTSSEAMGTIRVTGGIVFENRSKSSLLLLRRPPEYHGFRMRPVSPTPYDPSVYESYPTIIHPTAPIAYSYLESDFIRLRPNEQHMEPNFSFGVFYRKPGGDPGLRLPAEGDFWLSFRVSVWHDSAEEAARAAKALGTISIWTPYLWSEPIKVEVRSTTPVEVCL
jgi:hypothetical protein